MAPIQYDLDHRVRERLGGYPPGAGKDCLPTQLAEFRNGPDLDKILSIFRANVVQLSDRRLALPETASGPGGKPKVTTLNEWDVNMPGTTVWMPISNVTWQFINVLLNIEEGGFYLVDDMSGNVPCGVKRWADNGYLNGNLVMTLSNWERFVVHMLITEASCMMQNLQLAHVAMGLGGWTFANPAPLVVMGGTPLTKGLGFRFLPRRRGIGTGTPGTPNPVGIDGPFEAYCPPYYRSIDDAAEAVAAAKWGSTGIYTPGGGPNPYLNRSEFEAQVPHASAETIQIAKDICNYIYGTYGSLPATYDSMHMHCWTQSHHLETDYYDTYYPPGAYLERHRTYMSIWHAAR